MSDYNPCSLTVPNNGSSSLNKAGVHRRGGFSSRDGTPTTVPTCITPLTSISLYIISELNPFQKPIVSGFGFRVGVSGWGFGFLFPDESITRSVMHEIRMIRKKETCLGGQCFHPRKTLPEQSPKLNVKGRKEDVKAVTGLVLWNFATAAHGVLHKFAGHLLRIIEPVLRLLDNLVLGL